MHKSKAFLGKLSWRERYGVSLKQMCMCAGGEQCIMGVKRLAFWTGYVCVCVCVCVCVSLFPGEQGQNAQPDSAPSSLPCKLGFGWILFVLKKAKHFNVATESVTTGSVLFPIPQLFLQVCNLFARCLHTESVSFLCMISVFQWQVCVVKQTLKGDPILKRLAVSWTEIAQAQETEQVDSGSLRWSRQTGSAGSGGTGLPCQWLKCLLGSGRNIN